MTIKVLLQSIEQAKLQQILDHYNKNKLDVEQPLELLDRCEGGFKINIDYMNDKFCDDNKKIKQLRWNNGFLVSQYYIPFSKLEEKRLYDALVHVLGVQFVLNN